MFNNKSVLITGATGSFGQQFVKKIIHEYTPERLIIYSRDELKQYEMQSTFPETKFPNIRYFLGDIRDLDRLKLATKNIDILVHAAALKQVPAAEYNPMECIKTNIHGAQNVIEASIENNIKRVIALSTDKAVNPINLYGATKLASDKLFISANNIVGKNDINFSVVRYGNVVNSRGSVIPLFLKLISEKSKYFPITDQRMTRFWITLNQSIEFVIKSIERMSGGEVFVPKIPSFHITDLAKAIDPSKEEKIVGIRPGEKIHEIMVPSDEAFRTYEFTDHYVISPTITIEGHSNDNQFSTNKLQEAGKKCSRGFEYNSGSNNIFLDASSLRKELIKLKIIS
jgi:UDP-N-acetylglucosamine 4,6-dehydratase